MLARGRVVVWLSHPAEVMALRDIITALVGCVE